MKNKIYQMVTDQIITQLEQVELSDYNKPWFCVGHLGLEAKPREDHAQYIKSWLSALRGDNSFVISAASHAQKAADYALQCMADQSETGQAAQLQVAE